MKKSQLKSLVKEILKEMVIKEEVNHYVEKKTLAPKHARDERILGKFFDDPKFGGRVSVVNGTQLLLNVKVEKMNNPDTGQQAHLITITTENQ